ncbi:hypothetical protein [Microvirga sesbaniae]|uniref:hypothetical protein n=1 Tax=Microvirga sesbaniae TaxID=681392 RepID=UPI0021CABD58|nr:hypothetical protein [Microvirga sp. HBU67692]
MAKNKAKTPKTIAAVRVPKALRKSGWLDPLLADPQMRELLADVLIAAAGAAAAPLVKERPSWRQVADAGTAARDLVQGTADAATGVISEAAKAILPSSLTGSDTAAMVSEASGGTAKPIRRRTKRI